MSRVQLAVHAARGAADLIGAVRPGAWIEADAFAASGRRFGQDPAARCHGLHRDFIESRAIAVDVSPHDEGGWRVVVQGWADFLYARGNRTAFEHAGGERPRTGALLELDQQRVVA